MLDKVELLLLLVRSSNDQDWVLPKGHIDPGETPEQAALQRCVRRFAERHPEIDIVTDWRADGKGLPEAVQHVLYRIGQEALNNVGKHAGATTVEIGLRQDEGALRLAVRDDGRGFHTPERLVDLARRDHFGLLGAVERAEMVGGRLDVVSAPGDGTTVTVVVPLDEPIANGQ